MERYDIVKQHALMDSHGIPLAGNNTLANAPQIKELLTLVPEGIRASTQSNINQYVAIL